MFKEKIKLILILAIIMMMVLGSLSLVSVAQEDTTYKMVFIVKSLQMPFFLSMIEGAEQAADDLGIDLDSVGPTEPYNTAQQLDLIDNAIAMGVDGIIITPADSNAIVRGIQKANEAGIPIATPNTKAYGGEVLTWIGVENFEVGYGLGKYLADSLDGKGNVVLLEGTPGSSTAEERQAGFVAAFEEYPDINILASQTANFNRSEGMTVMENMLQRFPEIDGVGAANKEMIMGALEAAKAAGRAEEIKMVGFDVDSDVLTAVKDGDVIATGDQQEKTQAYLGVLACWTKLKGHNIPKEQYLPLKIVDKSNLHEYQDLMK